MAQTGLSFDSEDAENAFESLNRKHKDALVLISKKLQKPMNIMTEVADSDYIISETKAIINREGSVSKLNLSWNQLTEVPLEIKSLNNLKELYLHANAIDKLPDFWDKFQNLTRINLFSNNIEILPKSMNKLTDLQEINLGYNRLTRIPQCITFWKQAEVILTNNPIEVFGWHILKSDCICYFTEDMPKMGIGYMGDFAFTGVSKKIWNSTIKKYSGYRQDAEKVWISVKKKIGNLYDTTKDRIIENIKKNKNLDIMDYEHPDFEDWIPELQELCHKTNNRASNRLLSYINKK